MWHGDGFKNVVRLIGIAISTALGFYCLYLTTQASTPKESALSAIMLTLMSLLVGWIVTHYYYLQASAAEIERINAVHDKSLRTYALKAAEKVTNLSRELDRLAAYLLAYRDAEEDDNLDIVLCSKEDHISAVIHIVSTLKSVNDTSLSDWQGVIGAELERKKQEQEEEEDRHLQALIRTVEQVQASVKMLEPNSNSVQLLRQEFAAIRAELMAEQAGRLGVSSPRIYPFSARKPVVFSSCPECGNEIRIKVNRKGRIGARGYRCSACNTALVVLSDDSDKPQLIPRKKEDAAVTCPSCDSEQVTLVDNLPGVSSKFACAKCHLTLLVTRTNSGVAVRIIPPVSQPLSDTNVSVTPEFVDAVRMALPAQPWPTGVHKKVAERLGVPSAQVQKAIRTLILAGIFKHQIDGVVVQDGPRSGLHA
ncbi:MAG: hypothetical protein JSR78_11465 [Proteobacteria bacterium]|nr:hypothetical protein [Pseudomonadota bacterium]